MVLSYYYITTGKTHQQNVSHIFTYVQKAAEADQHMSAVCVWDDGDTGCRSYLLVSKWEEPSRQLPVQSTGKSLEEGKEGNGHGSVECLPESRPETHPSMWFTF